MAIRPPMRAEVAESWHRSAAAGVRPDVDEAPITLDVDLLRDHREAHPLAAVFPALDDVLGQAARDFDAVMAVSDASAQLLWVCGSPSALRQAERIGFVEGSNWDERLAGTNAPGVALTLDRPVAVIGQEHFRRSVQQWSCAASPIHHPTTREVLGVLDVTGGAEVAAPQTLAMVRAAARMAESELAQRLLSAGPPVPESRGTLTLHVEALGRSEALVTVTSGGRRRERLRLSPRHSEILVLLASAPRGLSGDELAVLLYEDDQGTSTLRAEVNRFAAGARRRAARLASVPAAGRGARRLARRRGSDDLGRRGQRTVGVLGRAVAPVGGPGVQRLRDALADDLRTRLITSGAPT
ncbi:GAF domain-containing protein [Nocardioides daphniae]|uniref:GAF domain-containing protein n=1 Tax=Nocardioides daphniae TaxID=402297 RepID=UPI001EE9742F|nr:GAF domain-containing protein [Nocardioides daphniae]